MLLTSPQAKNNNSQSGRASERSSGLPNDIELLIDKTGRIVFIHNDELVVALADLGVPITQRASHVDPAPGHSGKWLANMSPSTGTKVVLGPFNTRREALQSEIEYLQQFLAK